MQMEMRFRFVAKRIKKILGRSLIISPQVERREDEEQKRKEQEIIDILVGAGYYRAHIQGLSIFDKIVGGMTWCIEACDYDVDVDLLFHENLTIGQKMYCSLLNSFRGFHFKSTRLFFQRIDGEDCGCSAEDEMSFSAGTPPDSGVGFYQHLSGGGVVSEALGREPKRKGREAE